MDNLVRLVLAGNPFITWTLKRGIRISSVIMVINICLAFGKWPKNSKKSEGICLWSHVINR